ncbi:MAG: Holliday junction branch migration protein RuvA [Armatimonadetes bacterium]|nr:Holliday junction branch migration protein RuvA [Armatimonadota bacterium]
MIAHVAGELAVSAEDYVVVSAGGIGYKIFVPGSTQAGLPAAGEKIRLFTYLHVREDALTLYGFSDTEQQEVFELLIGVSGIGPKVALAILSAMSPESLAQAVAGEDVKTIQRIPGIGAKTAQRMVLELKEKMAALAWAHKVEQKARPERGSALEDVIEGLVALGYSRPDARRAAETVLKDRPDLTDPRTILRAALQSLGRQS